MWRKWGFYLSQWCPPRRIEGAVGPMSMASLDRLLDESLLEETALLKAGGQKCTGVCKPLGGTVAARVFRALWPPEEAVARYLCYRLGLKANDRH